MKEYWNDDNYTMTKEKVLPVAVKDSYHVEFAEELCIAKPACVSFLEKPVAKFNGKGAYVVLDYGKELCGGTRIVTRATFAGPAKFRVTFGESLAEAYAGIGEKNATNDHSPRDFELLVSNMSDLTFGQTGFRFVRLELLSEDEVWIKNIYAVNTLPVFEKEGYLITSDEKLNQIIDTATYTLKLCFQNGYIWDGIKRDRLVWSGDLNQEIITSLYLFGDNANITNSLSFLRMETPEDTWVNGIPSYSAWWILNLCDYCRITGNQAYFKENQDYTKKILSHFNQCISENGEMTFGDTFDQMDYYLDWPTKDTTDAIIGTACVILLAAKSYLALEENADCADIIRKLEKYLDMECEFKQTRAFQIIAGRNAKDEDAFLEKNGAKGFSTFMTYYILTADALAGGTQMLSLIKEYYGAMLDKGATTFWEDFHMDWCEGSGRIDELPAEGEKDIHGDFGAFCYEGFRHSFCHGWASGVIAFLIEYMLGLSLKDGGASYELHPHAMGVERIEAKLPVRNGYLQIQVENGKVVKAEIISA